MATSDTKFTNLIEEAHNRANDATEALNQVLKELERQKTENDKEYNKKLEQLNEEQRQWNEEKKTMEKLVASASPIVNLNVGGEIMATTRATLTLAEGSLLATMFSGRWDNKLIKDTNGNVFLDYDPVLFKYLLNQLRTWSNPSAKRIFRLPVGSEQPFLDLIGLLKFDDQLIESNQNTNNAASKISQSIPDEERFEKTSGPGVQLTDNNRRCKLVGSGWHYVLGIRTYSTGSHRIRLKLEIGTVNVLVGICSQSKPPKVSPFYDQPSTYGWFIHGYVMASGHGSHPGWPKVQVNDILEMTIDCDKRSLSILNEASKAQHTMQVDITGTPFPWCLLVLSDQNGSQICLL